MNTLSQPMRPNIPGAGEPQGPAPFTVTMKAPVAPAAPTEPATPATRAAALLDDTQRRFEDHLAGIEPGQYSPEGLAEQVASFTGAGAIDAAVEITQNRVDQAADHVDRVLKGLSPDLDTAGELRAGRAWSRVQRQLDAITDSAKVAETARQLIAASDDIELGVLMTEIKPYLASRGQDAGWLAAAVAQRVPELAAAQTELVKAEKVKAIIRFRADSLRNRITDTRSPAGYRAPIGVDVDSYDPDRP